MKKFFDIEYILEHKTFLRHYVVNMKRLKNVTRKKTFFSKCPVAGNSQCCVGINQIFASVEIRVKVEVSTNSERVSKVKVKKTVEGKLFSFAI